MSLVPDVDKTEHKKVAAWFLGPKAENEKEFGDLIAESLHSHAEWRRLFFPQDPAYVTDVVKSSDAYQKQMALLKKELHDMSIQLRNSVPFFSSRYKAHMVVEPSLVGMLGYFTGMLYNQNNVASEASTVTSPMEVEIGRELCAMLGFDVEKSFGHLTSSGSVANFDSLWAARNIKYLSYALRKVLDNPDAGFNDLRAHAKVIIANGTEKLLFSIDPTTDLWILLNIPASRALDLYDVFLADKKAAHLLQEELTKYSVTYQGLQGMPGLPAYYYASASCHYSHPKGGALMGIGQQHMIRITLNEFGRIDVGDLEHKLLGCLKEHRPVIQVVAVIGTTGEGAVDDVESVLALREKLRKEGLDFAVHADAAWGGYFRTMEPPISTMRLDSGASSSFVASLPLSSYVVHQLRALGGCDTIILDPHKSGYIQYPAGAVCFADKRIKTLLAYIVPYLVQQPTGDDDGEEVPDYNVGLFGVDGSRRGLPPRRRYFITVWWGYIMKVTAVS
jgi:glutamate/tyrosine decarboxylase-like PLP-dependent enzyme